MIEPMEPRGVASRGSTASEADVLAFVEETWDRWRRAFDGSETLVLSVPVQAAPVPRALWSVAPAAPAFWWRASGDGGGVEEDVAVGATRVLETEGRGRDLLEALDRLWRGTRCALYPGLAAREPRLFGGLAFVPGSADDALWRGFGDVSFVLPRLYLTRRRDELSLTLALPRAEADLPAPTDEVARVLSGLAGAVEASRETGLFASTTTTLAALTEATDGREFRERVARIRRGIRDGRVEKVVAARRLELPIEGFHGEGASEQALLARLAEVSGGGALFARRQDGALFFGAAPERLVRQRGRDLWTEAVAGSRRREGADERVAEELYASRKDRWEHEIVVRHLVERLRPSSSVLEWPERPGVRRLRHILHLWTPLRARLRECSHVLESVDDLHPTPAIAGAPAEAAREWIRTQEPVARGWYAGPVGWIDRAGDGDLWIALRSALIRDRAAHLFAGAGVVDDSEPESELAETEVKLRTMLEAFAPVVGSGRQAGGGKIDGGEPRAKSRRRDSRGYRESPRASGEAGE